MTEQLRKESFILHNKYKELLVDLSQSQKGDLLDALFEYSLTGEIPKLEPIVLMAFRFICKDIDYHNNKYLETCEKNRQNVLKRWGDTSVNEGIPEDTTVYDRIRVDTKHTDKDKGLGVGLGKDKILDKSNGDKSPQGDKKEFGSAEVNAVEKSIRKRLGYLPIAYKGKERFVIHNMIRLCTPMGTSGVKKGRGWMQDSWRSNWANFWKEEMDKYEHGNLRIEKMETLYDKLKLWIDKETTKFIKENNEYSKE